MTERGRQPGGMSLREGMGLLMRQGLEMTLWGGSIYCLSLHSRKFFSRAIAQWLKGVFSDKAEDLEVICYVKGVSRGLWRKGWKEGQ